MSTCTFREGKTEESVKYYEMFLEVSEKMNDDTCISKASNCLGQLFNKVVSNLVDNLT